jgi:hypothetical protein
MQGILDDNQLSQGRCLAVIDDTLGDIVSLKIYLTQKTISERKSGIHYAIWPSTAIPERTRVGSLLRANAAVYFHLFTVGLIRSSALLSRELHFDLLLHAQADFSRNFFFAAGALR